VGRNNHITNSFASGEVSPKLFGRTEIQQYNQACEKIENMIVVPQGGAEKRPGTRYVQKITESDTVTHPDSALCIPFVGADGTTWQIIITSESPDQTAAYIGPPGETSTTRWPWYAVNTLTHEVEQITAFFDRITGISDPWYLTDYYESLVNQPNDLHYAQTGDMLILTTPNFRPLQIVYDPTPASAAYAKFNLHSFPRYEKASTADTLPITTPSELWRQMPFENAIASNAAAEISLTVSAGAPTVITVTGASTIAFTADWHGKYIKFTKGAEAMVIMVWDVDSSTSAKVVAIAGAIAGTSTTAYGSGATNVYEEGYWDDVKGWPRAVTFFENRVVFGGTDTYPDSVWLSRINNINWLDVNKLVTDADYATPWGAEGPFSTNLKAEMLAKIQWMSPGKTIATGTLHREFILQGPSPTESISETNQQSQAETSQGSARAMAVRVENAVIFMQKDRRTLRELFFNFQEDSFEASNISIMAPHMGLKIATDTPTGNTTERPYFLQIVKQDDVVWVLNNTGGLCGMTRSREQKVAAWHFHRLAGYGPYLANYATDVAAPVIRCLSAVLSGVSDERDEGSPDDLFMVVERGEAVAGERYLCLERMNPPWDKDAIWSAPGDRAAMWVCNDEPKYAPVYLDCAFLTDATTQRLGPYSNAPGIISGLPYGDAAVVSVVVDGQYIGEYTVDVDEIDISAAIADLLNVDPVDDAWQAIVGFSYTAQLVPTCPEVQAVTGSSQGQLRRVDQLSVHLYNTIGASVGRLADDEQENTPVDAVEEVLFEPGENQDDPIPLFTGVKTMNFPGGYERRPRILIESDLPFPMHVTHVVARMMVSE
jgi:hypothetical protein